MFPINRPTVIPSRDVKELDLNPSPSAIKNALQHWFAAECFYIPAVLLPGRYSPHGCLLIPV